MEVIKKLECDKGLHKKEDYIAFLKFAIIAYKYSFSEGLVPYQHVMACVVCSSMWLYLRLDQSDVANFLAELYI